MIDSLYQSSIDASLDDQVRRPFYRPLPPAPFSLMNLAKSPFQGVGAGGGEALASLSEISNIAGETLASTGTLQSGGMFSTQTPEEQKTTEALAKKIRTEGPTVSNDFADSVRQRASEIMPDPATTDRSSQVVAGLFRFGSKAATHGLMFGPAAPVALGVDEGLTEADRLKQQGVDVNTRTAAGALTGTVVGGSMLVPLSGGGALLRFGKGVSAGEGGNLAQGYGEKWILDRAGYSKIANTFDPLDPVNLAVGALPGVLGLWLGRGQTKVGDLSRDSSLRSAADMTPQEMAHEQAYEASAANLSELKAAIESERKAGRTENVAALEAELAKQQAAHDTMPRARPIDPRSDEVAAARVVQTSDALDAARLTDEGDLPGMEAHRRAVETAFDQLGRGDEVEVSPVLGLDTLDRMRESRLIDDQLQALDQQRAEALADAGNFMEPGAVRQLRQDVVDLQARQPDTSPAAIKSRAKELQAGPDRLSYKQALALAQKEADTRAADFSAQMKRLQDQIDAHGRAARAQERIASIDREAAPLRDRAASMEGPRTAPRRLSLAVAEAVGAMRQMRGEVMPEPIKPQAQAFHEAVSASEAARETPAGKPAAAPAQPAPAREAGAAAAPSHDGALAQLLATNPDMLVHMDGLDEPVRLADLMESVRADAAEMGRDAKLLEVAAQCAITA